MLSTNKVANIRNIAYTTCVHVEHKIVKVINSTDANEAAVAMYF